MTREALDKFRARVPAAQKMQDGDFMDWRVEFTYLNNFVNVVADYRCVCVCVCVCVHVASRGHLLEQLDHRRRRLQVRQRGFI